MFISLLIIIFFIPFIIFALSIYSNSIFLNKLKVYLYVFLSFIKKDFPNLVTVSGFYILFTQFIPEAISKMPNTVNNVEFLKFTVNTFGYVFGLFIVIYAIGYILDNREDEESFKYIIEDIIKDKKGQDGKELIIELEKMLENKNHLPWFFKIFKMIILICFIVMILLISTITIALYK